MAEVSQCAESLTERAVRVHILFRMGGLTLASPALSAPRVSSREMAARGIEMRARTRPPTSEGSPLVSPL